MLVVVGRLRKLRYSMLNTPTVGAIVVGVAPRRMDIAESLARKIILTERKENLSDLWRVGNNDQDYNCPDCTEW